MIGSTVELDDGRGILYPRRLPTFHREPAPTGLEDLIRWLWIPRWSLPEGIVSRQEILPFPASNLVVEPDGVTLVGPASRVSHRDLSGTGWAVGALLRPAALAHLHSDPRLIQDDQLVLDEPDLHLAVANAMSRAEERAGRRCAARELGQWAAARLPAPSQDGALANAMEDLIASDRTIVRVPQVAERLGISVRGVQRLAQRFIGLAPLAVIRRYRLQEAARRLREEPDLTVAHVAADLGYSDHAHLSADFRRVLGFAPSSYRHSLGAHDRP